MRKDKPPAYWVGHAMRASAQRITRKYQQKQKKDDEKPGSDREAVEQNADHRKNQG